MTCSRFFFWAIATCCQLQPLPPPIPHRVSWLSGACGGESRWIRLTWWHGNSSSQWLAGNLASTSPQALDPAILIYISMWWWLDSHYRGRSQQHVGKQHHFVGNFPDCFPQAFCFNDQPSPRRCPKPRSTALLKSEAPAIWPESESSRPKNENPPIIESVQHSAAVFSRVCISRGKG